MFLLTLLTTQTADHHTPVDWLLKLQDLATDRAFGSRNGWVLSHTVSRNDAAVW
jgi:hypothetical protein